MSHCKIIILNLKQKNFLACFQKQQKEQPQTPPPPVQPCRWCLGRQDLSNAADSSNEDDGMDCINSDLFDSDEPSLRRLAPSGRHLLPCEQLLHVGATSDGGAVSLTDYRLLLIRPCGRLAACLPAGLLERPAVIADAPAADGLLLSGGVVESADSGVPESSPGTAADSGADTAKPRRREASRLLLTSRLGRAPLRLGFPRPGDAAVWAERLDPAGQLARSSDRAAIGAALRRQAEDRQFEQYAAELSEEEFLAEQARLGLVSPAVTDADTSASEQSGSPEAVQTFGQWRQTESPAGLCPSYPRLHTVPAGLSDDELALSAKYRANGRFPSVVWRCSATGAVLARSAQPLVGLAGLLGYRCEADEKLVRLLTPRPESKVLVADARPYSAALGNGTMGGGYERPEYYAGTEIQYLGLPNLHAVRSSFAALRALLAAAAASPEPAAPACPGLDNPVRVLSNAEASRRPGQLESTGWLQLLAGLLGGADRVAQVLTGEGRSVLVHCSDGWDRTPQLTCLCLLMCEPRYRSLAGFRLLLTREWLDFGHKFADRCGGDKANGLVGGNVNERSPIFLQFLDCVHQLLAQFPEEFEFTELLLRRLAVHCHSGLFPALTANSAAQRAAARLADRSLCPWHLLRLRAARNRRYRPRQPPHQPLRPAFGVSDLRLWAELYAPAPDPGLDWDKLDWDGLPAECDRLQSEADSGDLASQLSQLTSSPQQPKQQEGRPEADAESDPVLQSPPPAAADGRIAVQS